MLIVIASETYIQNETKIVNQLFQAGLECFHLRKPTYKLKDYEAFLNDIAIEFHNRIVIHDYHELINEYDLKGIHFSEPNRINNLEQETGYFKGLNMMSKTISTSFHDVETLKHCDFEFDYQFLSPVFTSISKSDYQGKQFDVTGIDKPIIALGGIHMDNVSKVKALGYAGVAVLGSVWGMENPILAYKKVQFSANY